MKINRAQEGSGVEPINRVANTSPASTSSQSIQSLTIDDFTKRETVTKKPGEVIELTTDCTVTINSEKIEEILELKITFKDNIDIFKNNEKVIFEGNEILLELQKGDTVHLMEPTGYSEQGNATYDGKKAAIYIENIENNEATIRFGTSGF